MEKKYNPDSKKIETLSTERECNELRIILIWCYQNISNRLEQQKKAFWCSKNTPHVNRLLVTGVSLSEEVSSKGPVVHNQEWAEALHLVEKLGKQSTSLGKTFLNVQLQGITIHRIITEHGLSLQLQM